MAARHYLCKKEFYFDGHWREKTDTDWMLFNEIPVLHAPWQRMSGQEFRREFGKCGVNGYIKDLLNRHDGEVVQTSGDWKDVFEPMPTDAAAWHKQFATNARDRQILASQRSITEKMHLVHHTTVLYPRQGGHMRREGMQITLGELMMELGSHYTLMEIYYWYYHAERLCYKKDHSWGSTDVQDGGKLRKRELGGYGHGWAERKGWYKDNV